MRSVRVKVVAFMALLFLGLHGTASAVLVNGDFSSGSSGWTTTGDVSVPGGSAVLTDLFGDSSLYQGVALASGLVTLEFDFLNELLDGAFFPDTFFASVYLIDDIGDFDLGFPPVYDDAIALFDMDYLGVFNENSNASITASALGGNWQHFSLTFNNVFNFVIPTFELLDLSGEAEDGAVQIDNVTLSMSTPPVPEPATITLLGLGIFGCAIRRIGSSRKAANSPS